MQKYTWYKSHPLKPQTQKNTLKAEINVTQYGAHNIRVRLREAKLYPILKMILRRQLNLRLKAQDLPSYRAAWLWRLAFILVWCHSRFYMILPFHSSHIIFPMIILCDPVFRCFKCLPFRHQKRQLPRWSWTCRVCIWRDFQCRTSTKGFRAKRRTAWDAIYGLMLLG